MNTGTLRRLPWSLFALVAVGAHAAPILEDTFEDGNFTVAVGTTGLSWSVVTGTAVVETVESSRRLGLPGGTNAVVAQQSIALDAFTLGFDARVVWSNPARVLFLYVDPSNYYALGLGSDDGVFRRLNGTETQLYNDAGNQLRLPHLGSATNHFKIFAHNTGTAIELRFDRAGDGRDYDVALVDTNPAAVALFHNTRVGVANAGGSPAQRLFHLDNVTVESGLVENPRTALTYYVGAETGDDARTAEAAQSAATPWRTLQRAADVLLSGDTVLVLPGVYRETVVPKYSGNASHPIVYRAASAANRPVLDGSDGLGATGWQSVVVTGYEGTVRSVFRHELAWIPPAAYQDGVRLFAAQEPNQSNPDDPYNPAAFRDVPAASNPGTSYTQLVDPAFLIQPDVDYWKGATLLLYDSAGNYIYERPIVGYDPLTGSLTAQAFGATIGSGDKYALRNHPGILDQPGEYVVDAVAVPPQLYVWPRSGSSVTNVMAARRTHAFDLGKGDYANLQIDGFELRFFADHAIDIQTRSTGIEVRNCRIHRSMASGVSVDYADGVLVSNCWIAAHYDNGVSFGAGRNYAVVDCEITANGNNGVWAGTGGGTIFNTDGVTIRGNVIHHQSGRRSHADNYQMHQCDNVLLENNVLVQDGFQNGWCQYTGHLTMRNNIVLNGNFGANSVMFSEIYHNVFASLSLRYDAHLTDHPERGDYYKPQRAVVRDNLFFEASLGWPATSVLDRFAAFTTDHNYYNSANAYTLEGWEWQGYRCGLNRGGGLLLTTQTADAAGLTFACRGTTIWGEPAHLVVLYKDSANYYTLGIRSDPGLFRILDGQRTQLATPSGMALPHASPSIGNFVLCVTNSGVAIQFLLARDNAPGTYDAVVLDTNPAAVARFVGSTRAGLMTANAATNTAWCFVDDVVLADGTQRWGDDFEDGDCTTAAGPTGLTWSVAYGTAAVAPIKGRGVGYGEGSVVHTSAAALAQQIVLPPDATFSQFDFHLLKTSLLRDAGLDVGVVSDLDGLRRPLGSGVDIGPYEYVPPSGGSLLLVR